MRRAVLSVVALCCASTAFAQAQSSFPGSLPRTCSDGLLPSWSSSTLTWLCGGGRYESKIADFNAADLAAPVLAGTGAGNVSNGTHRYKFAYCDAATPTLHCTADSGTATDAVTVTDNTVNGKVTVTIPFTCNSNYPYVHIYRDKNSDGIYKEVGNNDWGCDTTFTDNVADGSLGAVMPTVNTTVNGFSFGSDGGLRGFLAADTWGLPLVMFSAPVPGLADTVTFAGSDAFQVGERGTGFQLLAGGSPDGQGGEVRIYAADAFFGNVSILGGYRSASTGTAGTVLIRGGATTSGALAGDVTIAGGVVTGGGGTAGSVSMQTAGTNRIVVGPTGLVDIDTLKTTGSAGGKKVVCVDTSNGRLYASSTGTDCSN